VLLGTGPVLAYDYESPIEVCEVELEGTLATIHTYNQLGDDISVAVVKCDTPECEPTPGKGYYRCLHVGAPNASTQCDVKESGYYRVDVTQRFGAACQPQFGFACATFWVGAPKAPAPSPKPVPSPSVPSPSHCDFPGWFGWFCGGKP
jgi:hypothetical protein